MKKKAETFLLGYLFALGYRIALESYFAKDGNKEELEFRTINGTPVPIGKKGELKGRIGKKIEKDQAKKAAKENTPKNIADFLGQEYKNVKGADAIDKLRKEQNGHVKAAFHRKEIGDIDLVWGNEKGGLCHIIKQRRLQNIDIDDFLKELPRIINKGEISFNTERGRFEIKTAPKISNKGKKESGRVAVISPTYKGKKLTWLLTAFKSRK